MPIAADYPFLDILGTMIVFFGFVIWMWMLFAIFGDLFRRHDVSGWGKAGWTLLVFVIPLIGPLIYLLSQGRGMAERNVEEQQAAKGQFDEYVREAAGSDGPATEIAKAKQLLDSGAIDQAEFERLKQRALG
jgi:Short C-terminal domain/Phospholipase_D-nuclease N-terminal